MRILAFGAHADDIEISMGGTIAKHVSAGHDVKMVVAIIPDEDKEGVSSKKARDKRWKEGEGAAEILGADLEILDLDRYEFRYDRHNVKIFDKIVRDYKPDKVYTSWNHDSHMDHLALSNIIFAATRRNIHSVYMYEPMTPGGITPYSFRANMFVDISGFIGTKMDSVKAYKSVRNLYETWIPGIDGRARYRGDQIGVEYAEAFEVVKEIKNF